jgi:hypothetical protein
MDFPECDALEQASPEELLGGRELLEPFAAAARATGMSSVFDDHRRAEAPAAAQQQQPTPPPPLPLPPPPTKRVAVALSEVGPPVSAPPPLALVAPSAAPRRRIIVESFSASFENQVFTTAGVAASSSSSDVALGEDSFSMIKPAVAPMVPGREFQVALVVQSENRVALGTLRRTGPEKTDWRLDSNGAGWQFNDEEERVMDAAWVNRDSIVIATDTCVSMYSRASAADLKRKKLQAGRRAPPPAAVWSKEAKQTREVYVPAEMSQVVLSCSEDRQMVLLDAASGMAIACHQFDQQ